MEAKQLPEVEDKKRLPSPNTGYAGIERWGGGG